VTRLNAPPLGWRERKRGERPKRGLGVGLTFETKFIHDFHGSSKFEKRFNATFIALIPRKIGAIDLKDFCPISLVSGVYKIIVKALELFCQG
jgi:hypothetical protein